MPNNWGSPLRRALVWGVGCSALILAVISIKLSLSSQYWYPRVYAFWVIAPPSWFFVEYYFVFDRKSDAGAVEQLKIGQDVSQKFWAALLVLLGGIGYFRWHLTLH